MQNMQSVLYSLEKQANWKQLIRKACRKNKVSAEIANFFTPNKIRIIFQRFSKVYETKTDTDSYCWLENQLKAFHWFLVVLSALRQKSIEQFTEQQWEIMTKIFGNKDKSTLEYEAIKLFNQRFYKSRQWSKEQIDFLIQIINQNQISNKWNDIARKLYQRSTHKYFRSGKQCRERWLNHLDPNKKRYIISSYRGEWEEDEDKLIIENILLNGKRWSYISKKLGNHRTQHMVKNRFKTLIIKQKKLTPKIFNENTLVREIAKRILGQSAVLFKRQNVIKKQNQSKDFPLSNISEVSDEEDGKQMQTPNEKTIKKKLQTTLSPVIESQKSEQYKCESGIRAVSQEVSDINGLRDLIMPQYIEEGSKVNTSTPLNNYEIQQIYSPFYINYQGLTPYLSTSPSIPFFINQSFSSFDNLFNQNRFICPGIPNQSAPNSIEKKEESK